MPREVAHATSSLIVAAAVLAGCSRGGDPGVDGVPYDLRLGSWNIEKLGQETDTDYSIIAAVVEENFDVLGVAEVMVADGGHPGYDRMISDLGPGWDGFVTARPRPDALESWAEYYAVLWRRSVVRPCEGWSGMIYHPDNPGGPAGTGTNYFSREPAFVCLEAGFDMDGEEGTVGFDLVLAVYHALYASGDTAVTMAEVDHLDEVLASMGAAAPGEGDLVIVGDFNLEKADIEALVAATVITEGTGSTLNDSGNLSSNLIDNVLIRDPSTTSECMGPATVLDVRSLASSKLAFLETVSNHLPIVAPFRVHEDDD